AIGEIVPVRDDVVDRTTRVAIGRAAIHAAPALPTQLVVRERPYELLIMLEPVVDRFVRPIPTLILKKASGLSHFYSAAPTATLISGRSAARLRDWICCNARRYSIGMTFTNFERYRSQLARIACAFGLCVKLACRAISVCSSFASLCVKLCTTST